jgi:hypothetical protein
MNKILSLFSIALVLLAISFAYLSPVHSAPPINWFINATDDCQVLNACVEEGDDCNITSKCNTNSSGDPDCCGFGLTCFNGTCLYDNVDGYCTKANVATDCFGAGVLIDCINNTCTQQGLPGDDCEYNTDCYFNTHKLTDGTVLGCNVNTSKCDGLKFNSSCDLIDNIMEYACAIGTYCNPTTSRCDYLVGNNLPCVQNDVCADAYFCNTSGICAKPYTKGEGDNCTSIYDCDDDYICVVINETINWSQCQSPESLNDTDCISDKNCTKGYRCLCNTLSGEQYCVPDNRAYLTYEDCGSDFQDLRTCIGENNCSSYYYNLVGSSETLNPNSCVAENCEDEYDDQASCGCDVQEDYFDSCNPNQECSSFPLWAIIVIAIVGVILVLVVIVVIVMVMRKRRTTYDTIA